VSGSFTDLGQYFHIASLLKDIFLLQTLKVLTISITCPLENLRNTEWQDLNNSEIWKDLDLILSLVSTLQQMLIHLTFPYFLHDRIPMQFLADMQESMPLLSQRGILTFQLNGDPERDMRTDT
jgi:hypothetical protein